jgi:hypothetical protein
MLHRSTDRHCRRGAPVKNLDHSASFQSEENIAPSTSGVKQLAARTNELLVDTIYRRVNFIKKTRDCSYRGTSLKSETRFCRHFLRLKVGAR